MTEKTLAKTITAKPLQRTVEVDVATKQKTEMADAHCHLDLIQDQETIKRSIAFGVKTIITNGINFSTSRKAIAMADGRHIFAACGVDPETASKLDEEALQEEIRKVADLITKNRTKVVAIGEIGLDYTKAKDNETKAVQHTVFEKMLDLAKELDLPVSVHSRDSMDAVFAFLKKKKMQRVHLHFFEGNVLNAKEAERLGWMISIPPLDSAKRRLVAKDISIDRLMVESDCPVVGESPAWVEKSVRMIADMKAMPFEKTAEQLTFNTKKFFNIGAKMGVMRI